LHPIIHKTLKSLGPLLPEMAKTFKPAVPLPLNELLELSLALPIHFLKLLAELGFFVLNLLPVGCGIGLPEIFQLFHLA